MNKLQTAKTVRLMLKKLEKNVVVKDKLQEQDVLELAEIIKELDKINNILFEINKKNLEMTRKMVLRDIIKMSNDDIEFSADASTDSIINFAKLISKVRKKILH